MKSPRPFWPLALLPCLLADSPTGIAGEDRWAPEAAIAAHQIQRALIYQPPPGVLLSNNDYAKTDTPEVVWIPPGTFLMGSPDGEKHRLRKEGPQTQVTLRYGFWLGRFEITQGQYLAVMGYNPSCFSGEPNRPVENVSWDEAMQYCARLTQSVSRRERLPAGYVYRLPTEAEWEYAARAGTTTRFYFGDDPQYAALDNYAWYWGSSYTVAVAKDISGEAHGGHSSTTHPAGSKRANPWGLFDLYGNVEEWCWDWWQNTLPGGSVTDPQGPAIGRYRVLRGGSWRQSGRDCRSASRDYGWPDYRGKGTTGFRIALAPRLTPAP